jgi:hypothetical protein
MVIALAGSGNGCDITGGDPAATTVVARANTLAKPNILKAFKFDLQLLQRSD